MEEEGAQEMTKFNAGDKVRTVGKAWGRYAGKEGFVTDRVTVSGQQFMRLDGSDIDWAFDSIRPVELVQAADVAQEETNEVPADAANAFPAKVRAILSEIGDTLIAKNQQYGNSALEPVRIFSKASATEQIKVRMDDKISRLVRGSGEGDEDAQADLLGYIVLLKIAQSEDD